MKIVCSRCHLPYPAHLPWCDMCKYPNWSVDTAYTLKADDDADVNPDFSIGDSDEVQWTISSSDITANTADIDYNYDYLDYNYFFGLTEEEIQTIMDEQSEPKTANTKSEAPKTWDEKLKEELDRGEDTWGRISKKYK